MHQTENSKLNLQGKLRLKRSHKDSTQATSNSGGKMNFDNGRYQVKDDFKSNSADREEDSLADFKSPKQETIHKPILNKFKVDAGKTKKKIATSRAKSRKSDANQPSIEASLLKPQTHTQDPTTDFKEAILCPVCLKPFKDDIACTGHMKSCAAKNNVSIKQLLEAKRLQDRQAQERKAIGLLAAPIIPEKKKTFRNKNFSTGDDPQLQLVLAMSESLYQAEKNIELEEAAFLAGIPSECITEMNEEERKKTLQNFGFTTTKPLADIPPNKQRKKKVLAPTILQTRSREDKDRVLTERIACILTGEDALTQTTENTASSLAHELPRSITSKLLKKIERKDDKLWDQSRLTKLHHNFYVSDLKSHFLKSTGQQPVESEIHELLGEDYEKQDTGTLNTSVVYEPMDFDTNMNNQKIEQDTGNCEIFNVNVPAENNFESEFIQNVINGWKEALNDSSASDLVVLVKNNKCIYAHKLVFHIQCPNILLDVESLGLDSPIRQKISWLDKEEDSALAFLEFIYSGTIHKYTSIFYHKELVRQVEQLARLYRKQDLFAYVRKKQQEIKFPRRDWKMLENFNSVHEREVTNRSMQKSSMLKETETQVTQKKLHNNIHYSADKLIAKPHISNDLITEQSIDRRITASPDLFDSEEDEADSSKICLMNNSENDALALAISNNIKEEDNHVKDSDESDHLNSQKTLVNLSRSVSPVENIHEAITPPSGRSPRVHGISFNEQEIAEAVTPKRQSPEKILDIKQEVNESLANAVTPEYKPELSDHITPKKLVYADVVPNDVTAHIDESIYTAVTPPRLQYESGQMVDKKVHKSELTMFIEKVQRRNDKDIMDTDSETDSPDNRVRPKNPFSKKDRDDSYKYLRSNKDQKYHKAISLLEKDVLDEQKHLENFEAHFHESTQNDSERLENENPLRSEFRQVASGSSLTYQSRNTEEEVYLSDDEVQDITVNETEMSMYTEYKRSNKCDNSISFYRKQLVFDGQELGTSAKAQPRTIAEKHSSVSPSATLKKPKPRIIEDVTLVSDSEEEESPLRTFLRDKGKKKNDKSSSPVADMSNRDSKETAGPATSIEDHVTLDPCEESNILCSAVLKEESKSKVIDLSVDSDDGVIHDEASTLSNKFKELEEAEKKGQDIDAEISKILESSQKSRVHENWDQEELISLASSPEPCELANFNSQKSNNNNNNNNMNDGKYHNYSQNSESSLASGENGDFDVLALNDWNVKTPPRETARSRKSSEESSMKASSPVRRLNCDDAPANNAESSYLNALSNFHADNNQSTLISSPILCKNRRSLEDQERPSKISSKTNNKPESTRKLKVKSASTSSLNGKMGETKRLDLERASSSLLTPEQDKKSSNDTTPPIDYSLLDTPNLQKQLKKFGLKPQNRMRAKALLTHIYKETHSQPSASQKRSSNTGSSSEEDEPPAKRQYSKRFRETSRQEALKAKENCPVLAEEMDLDEPEVASAFQNPVSIKDAFLKLIKTNRELYNKVLTYEPLALETLHSMLKQDGFKCQLNSLMNFLDEQCITFQVTKDNKAGRIKK